MYGLIKTAACILLAATTIASAQTCSSTQEFNDINTFAQTRGCLPGGYSQALDAGQTTPDTLGAYCANLCTSRGSLCQAYVAQLNKAGESNLYTGQCFFYPPAAVPSGPAQCVDTPYQLLVGSKDDTNVCFASSTGAASAFCSSFVSVSTVTTYISTTTPVTVVTTKETSTTSSTRTSTSKTTTTFVAATVTTTSKTTGTTTQTSTITQSASTTTTTVTTAFSTVTVAALNKRQNGAVAGPSCLSSSVVPDSRLSSACSCLGVTTVTTSLISTAPASTSYHTSTVIKTTYSTTTVQTTSTKLSTTRTTLIISSTKTASSRITTISTTTFVSTTTTSTVTTTTSSAPPIVTNGGFDGGISPWYNNLTSTFRYATNGCFSPPGCAIVDLDQNPNGSFDNFIHQDSIALTANVQYMGSYSIKLVGTNPTCTPQALLTYLDNSLRIQNVNIAPTSPGGSTLTNDWMTFTGTFSVPAHMANFGELSVQVHCTDSSAAISFMVDSVSIVQA